MDAFLEVLRETVNSKREMNITRVLPVEESEQVFALLLTLTKRIPPQCSCLIFTGIRRHHPSSPDFSF